MDSVLYATLMIAGVIAVPSVLGSIAYAIKQGAKTRKAKKNLKRINKQNNDPKYKKQVAKERELERKMTSKTSLTFRSKKTKTTSDVVVNRVEDTAVINQVVIKGVMKCQCPDGVVRAETIYLMQPKYKTSDGAPVGPFLNGSGHLPAEAPYAVQDAQTGELLRADMPKVEAISGIPFDYVTGSKSFGDESLRTILSVDVPRDKKGNIVPVDFSDKKQLEDFKAYTARFSGKSFEDIAVYYTGVLEAAKETIKERKNRKIETYDVDHLFDDDKDEKQTQTQVQVQQADNGYDFYDRYNYHRPGWMGEMGTDYSYNVDLADHVFGPDGHHGHGPGRGPR